MHTENVHLFTCDGPNCEASETIHIDTFIPENWLLQITNGREEIHYCSVDCAAQARNTYTEEMLREDFKQSERSEQQRKTKTERREEKRQRRIEQEAQRRTEEAAQYVTDRTLEDIERTVRTQVKNEQYDLGCIDAEEDHCDCFYDDDTLTDQDGGTPRICCHCGIRRERGD